MKVTLIAAVFAAGMLTGGMWVKAQQPAPADLPAQRVTSIGGVFFKAKDPKALSAWYRDALGIALQAGGAYSLFEWREREDSSRLGHTVWSLFPSSTKYFAPSDATFMVNYRVRDLDKMLAQLRALGARIEPKVVDDFNGKFAWIVDPEGNKLELWEPKAGY